MSQPHLPIGRGRPDPATATTPWVPTPTPAPAVGTATRTSLDAMHAGDPIVAAWVQDLIDAQVALQAARLQWALDWLAQVTGYPVGKLEEFLAHDVPEDTTAAGTTDGTPR